jgi:two-component system LytT family response regulator
MKFKAIIVDDEILARQRLRTMLAEHSEEIEVVAEAGDAETATQQISKHKDVDVIFLDIQMPGQSGIELAAELPEKIHIVFTTAYDQYAIRAFENNTIDYLLKPIERERLTKTIDKLRQRSTADRHQEYLSLQQIVAQLQQKSAPRFTVREGDKAIFLDYDEIFFFRAEDKYVTVHTSAKDYLTRSSISYLEATLPGDIFLRSHRSALVNIHHIREAKRWFTGRYLLILDDPQSSEIPLSRNLKSNFGL